MTEKKRLIVGDDIRRACPEFVGGAVYASFENSAHSDALWAEIRQAVDEFRQTETTDSIKLLSGISATRQAYKACGKDPSRYRPSNEQLLRRTLQGKELWSVNTAVDIGNLASLRYHYSIGCFDFDKIEGETITLGIGRAGEPYEGIGRGILNIEGMPVYRDAIGGIGTPTSDHERTKMSLQTTRMLAVINGYDGRREQVLACAECLADAFRKYLNASCEVTTF
ncbi:MAG: hypothetical protein IJ816_01315 [Alloprevotella sp.]|nr:hypothetical protein [Alloprevotella sp.]